MSYLVKFLLNWPILLADLCMKTQPDVEDDCCKCVYVLKCTDVLDQP